jgi:protein pelota
VTLEVVVEVIDFDAVAGKLRLRGKNILENPHVRLGSYHTLELEKNRQFTLTKECWDKIHFEILRTAKDPTSGADVAAVVMQEGLAHICLVTSAMTHVRQKIEQKVPRKGKAALYGHDKAVRPFCALVHRRSLCPLNGVCRAQIKSFYEKTFLALRQHVDFTLVKCVLVAGPGARMQPRHAPT